MTGGRHAVVSERAVGVAPVAPPVDMRARAQAARRARRVLELWIGDELRTWGRRVAALVFLLAAAIGAGVLHAAGRPGDGVWVTRVVAVVGLAYVVADVLGHAARLRRLRGAQHADRCLDTR